MEKTGQNQNDIYILENNSTISASELLSYQNYFISEYNKNFKIYPPENKQLYGIFLLNSSFNSTIFVSYYRSVGFLFQKNNTPTTNIIYLNKSQMGISFPFWKLSFRGNVVFHQDNMDDKLFFIVDINYLNKEYLRKVVNRHYLLDYAKYLSENATLNKIEVGNLQKLNKAKEELNNICQTSDEIGCVKANLEYHQLADDLHVGDASSKKIVEDLKNKNVTKNESINETTGFIYTSFWHTSITTIYFLIIGFVFLVIERIKNKLKKQGKIGSLAYITYIFEGFLALGGLTYFVYQAPSELVFTQYLVITFSIIVGVFLILKYEKPGEVEQE